jgi:hypothetical protein
MVEDLRDANISVTALLRFERFELDWRRGDASAGDL